MRPHLMKDLLARMADRGAARFALLAGAALMLWTLWSVACNPANINDRIPYTNLDGSVSGPIDFAYLPRDLMPPPPDQATPDLLPPPDQASPPSDGGTDAGRD